MRRLLHFVEIMPLDAVHIHQRPTCLALLSRCLKQKAAKMATNKERVKTFCAA